MTRWKSLARPKSANVSISYRRLAAGHSLCPSRMRRHAHQSCLFITIFPLSRGNLTHKSEIIRSLSSPVFLGSLYHVCMSFFVLFLPIFPFQRLPEVQFASANRFPLSFIISTSLVHLCKLERLIIDSNFLLHSFPMAAENKLHGESRHYIFIGNLNCQLDTYFFRAQSCFVCERLLVFSVYFEGTLWWMIDSVRLCSLSLVRH